MADPWTAAHIGVSVLARMARAAAAGPAGARADALETIGVVYLGDELGQVPLHSEAMNMYACVT